MAELTRAEIKQDTIEVVTGVVAANNIVIKADIAEAITANNAVIKEIIKEDIAEAVAANNVVIRHDIAKAVATSADRIIDDVTTVIRDAIQIISEKNMEVDGRLDDHDGRLRRLEHTAS